RLDPRDPYVVYRYDWLGLAHLLESRTEEAIVWFDKARNLSPRLAVLHRHLASAYALKGESERATAELAEARTLNGEGSFSSIARVRAGLLGAAPKIHALVES